MHDTRSDHGECRHTDEEPTSPRRVLGVEDHGYPERCDGYEELRQNGSTLGGRALRQTKAR